MAPGKLPDGREAILKIGWPHVEAGDATNITIVDWSLSNQVNFLPHGYEFDI